MIVIWLMLTLFIGGALAWASELMDSRLPRHTALLALLVSLVLVLWMVWGTLPDPLSPGAQ